MRVVNYNDKRIQKGEKLVGANNKVVLQTNNPNSFNSSVNISRLQNTEQVSKDFLDELTLD